MIVSTSQRSVPHRALSHSRTWSRQTLLELTYIAPCLGMGLELPNAAPTPGNWEASDSHSSLRSQKSELGCRSNWIVSSPLCDLLYTVLEHYHPSYKTKVNYLPSDLAPFPHPTNQSCQINPESSGPGVKVHLTASSPFALLLRLWRGGTWCPEQLTPGSGPGPGPGLGPRDSIFKN